ncbi:TPA: ABC transporter ATP-binding protein, partial [Clostridium perfringens]|nr:ABC transporter ATP-binding protein [Clostridium perfringens]
KKNKLKLSIFLLISLFVWGISIILPLVNGRIIDMLVLKEFNENLIKMILIILFLNIFSVIFTFTSEIIYANLLSVITFKIQYSVLNHIKLLPLHFFNKNNSAYLNQQIGIDSNTLSTFIISNIKEFLFNIINLIISTIILFNISFKVTFSLIFLIPLYISLYKIFKKKLYSANYIYKDNQSELFNEMNTHIQNIKFIKINAISDILNIRLKKLFNKLLNSCMNLTKINSIFSNSGMLINVLANILILLIGIYEIMNENMTIGEFTIIGTYFGIFLNSMSYFLTCSKSYQSLLVSYDRIMNLFNIQAELNGSLLINDISKIELKNVNFSYDNNIIVLKDFSYTFNKGKIYKIIGENGKGKSSLINVIIGLYNNYTGNINYNDINIKNIDIIDLRKNFISVVEQEPVLMNDTIYNNLTYNIQHSKENLLNLTLKELNLDTFINSLENGMDTIISEKNYNLSGGQKQKLSVTRSLLKQPKLLILDEANSAMDKESVEKLNTLLKNIKKDMIIIIITHTETFNEIIDETIVL